MAVANIAALYAQQGKRVLVLDFDFEAPGLHRYFFRIEDAELPGRVPDKNRKGVLNYLSHVYDELQKQFPDGMNFDAPEAQQRLPSMLENWLFDGDYIHTVQVTNPDPSEDSDAPAFLHFIAAARFDATYAQLVRHFNWHHFDQLYREVFPALARMLSERYEFVLIDSRTGVTDIGSICTMLLPRKLVIVFTSNEQSLIGGLDAALQTMEERHEMHQMPLHVYPLFSLVDESEEKLRREWIKRSCHGFEKLFRLGYGLESCNLAPYFSHINIPYRGYYSYGDRIAVEEQPTSDRGSLAEAYLRFAYCLACDGVMAAQDALQKAEFGGIFQDLTKLGDVAPQSSSFRIPPEMPSQPTSDVLLQIDKYITKRAVSGNSSSGYGVFNALFQRAYILRDMGHHQAAIRNFDTIIESFASRNDVFARNHIATAYYEKSRILLALGLPEEAFAAVDEAVRKFPQSGSTDARITFASALALKAQLCGDWRRDVTTSSQILKDIVDRFGKSSEMQLLRIVCRAIVDMDTLRILFGEPQEAKELRDDMIQRFRDSTDIAIRYTVGVAMLHAINDMQDRPAEAAVLLDDILLARPNIGRDEESKKALLDAICKTSDALRQKAEAAMLSGDEVAANTLRDKASLYLQRAADVEAQFPTGSTA